MLRIDAIADLETAKRVAQLLEKENKKLHDRLHALTLELAGHRGEEGHEQYALEVVRLQEHLATLNKRLFAASTEKQAKPGDSSEKPTKAAPPDAPRERKTLPHVDVLHELDAADRACVLCGKELRSAGRAPRGGANFAEGRRYVT